MLANFPVNIKDAILRQLLEQWHRIFDGGIRLVNTTTNATTYTRENVDNWPVQFTSGAVANVEFAVNHGLGRIPIGFEVSWRDKAGHIYQGPATGTAWTKTQIFIKTDIATLTALILVY